MAYARVLVQEYGHLKKFAKHVAAFAIKQLRGIPTDVKLIEFLSTDPIGKDIGYDHTKFINILKSKGENRPSSTGRNDKCNNNYEIQRCCNHEKFKYSDGGYIADKVLDTIYELGARKGVVNFVVPGNKADRIRHYYSILKPIVADVSGEEPMLFSPGLIKQGGTINDAVRAAGPTGTQ